MQRSDSIKHVMTALGLFQSKAVKIRKDSTNPHFKSKYASLSVILDEIQPMLTECKLVFTQVPEESTHLITLLVHPESGEFIESRYELKSAQSTPQGIGSAITYARRYSLTALLGLNIDDDDDGNEASKDPKKSTPQQPAQIAAPSQQPQQIQNPFQKSYPDANAIVALIPTATKLEDLTQLYMANQATIESRDDIKKSMSAKRDTINNQGKVIITDNQYSQLRDRIRKGDIEAVKSAKGAFILNAGQIEELDYLGTQRQQLEDALALKYSNAPDILVMINNCVTEADIMRLHKNNAMIIDRDGEILTKLNAKLRLVKGK